MINFRYHIVSLVAVFLALAIGVGLGASVVGQGVNDQIVNQANEDRKQLDALRTEMSQVQALDRYRDAWADQAGQRLTANLLTNRSVALLVMPDTPNAVVQPLQEEIVSAGGSVTNTVTVNTRAFDPDEAESLGRILDTLPDVPSGQEPIATRLGGALARAMVAPEPQAGDNNAKQILTGLQGRYIAVDKTVATRASLLVIVGAPIDPNSPPQSKTVQDHVTLDIALAQQAGGTVLAGANSTGVNNSDVAAVRQSTRATDLISTVDVADLPSGVATAVLALGEELRGGHGHYGAASSSDAPAPKLNG